MAHGLCRSVRTEDPSMKLTTLDIEDPTNDHAVPSVGLLLRNMQDISSIKGFEGEYVDRGGVLHISRTLGDDEVNAAEHAKTSGGIPVDLRLHEAQTTVRMIAERVGQIDSLHHVEVDSKELPLASNKVK
ncbi:hypothetical protein P153DRAFT_431543, partial [Dothidotthia symphoricarpi CBS 119687]